MNLTEFLRNDKLLKLTQIEVNSGVPNAIIRQIRQGRTLTKDHEQRIKSYLTQYFSELNEVLNSIEEPETKYKPKPNNKTTGLWKR